MKDISRLESATTYMYFNLDRSLFQTTEYKQEIRELFETHWFLEEIPQLNVKSEKITNYSTNFNLTCSFKSVNISNI